MEKQMEVTRQVSQDSKGTAAGLSSAVKAVPEGTHLHERRPPRALTSKGTPLHERSPP